MLAALNRFVSECLGLGLDANQLTASQVSLRAAMVFLCALIIVRVASKRFVSRMTALDAILGFILASMLARAINGSAAFFPSLAGAFVLLVLHRLFASRSFRVAWIEALTKGHQNLVIGNGRVENGRIIESSLECHRLTRDDLLEELRIFGDAGHPEDANTAYLDRGGQISVGSKNRNGGECE
jgi:uncharacterized membrane protein YcaP (DUF421 family)